MRGCLYDGHFFYICFCIYGFLHIFAVYFAKVLHNIVNGSGFFILYGTVYIHIAVSFPADYYHHDVSCTLASIGRLTASFI